MDKKMEVAVQMRVQLYDMEANMVKFVHAELDQYKDMIQKRIKDTLEGFNFNLAVMAEIEQTIQRELRGRIERMVQDAVYEVLNK